MADAVSRIRINSVQFARLHRLYPNSASTERRRPAPGSPLRARDQAGEFAVGGAGYSHYSEDGYRLLRGGNGLQDHCVASATTPETDLADVSSRIRRFAPSLRPTAPRFTQKEECVYPRLLSSSHVFMRCDRVRRPMHSPYDGPFEVRHSGDRTFKLMVSVSLDTVSETRVNRHHRFRPLLSSVASF